MEGGSSPSFLSLFFSVGEGGVWRGGSERKGGSLYRGQFSRKVALAAQMAPPACNSGAHGSTTALSLCSKGVILRRPESTQPCSLSIRGSPTSIP